MLFRGGNRGVPLHTWPEITGIRRKEKRGPMFPKISSKC